MEASKTKYLDLETIKTELKKLKVNDLECDPRLLFEAFEHSYNSLNREDSRDRKSTRLNSSHVSQSRMPSSA